MVLGPRRDSARQASKKAGSDYIMYIYIYTYIYIYIGVYHTVNDQDRKCLDGSEAVLGVGL